MRQVRITEFSYFYDDKDDSMMAVCRLPFYVNIILNLSNNLLESTIPSVEEVLEQFHGLEKSMVGEIS